MSFGFLQDTVYGQSRDKLSAYPLSCAVIISGHLQRACLGSSGKLFFGRVRKKSSGAQDRPRDQAASHSARQYSGRLLSPPTPPANTGAPLSTPAHSEARGPTKRISVALFDGTRMTRLVPGTADAHFLRVSPLAQIWANGKLTPRLQVTAYFAETCSPVQTKVYQPNVQYLRSAITLRTLDATERAGHLNFVGPA